MFLVRVPDLSLILLWYLIELFELLEETLFLPLGSGRGICVPLLAPKILSVSWAITVWQYFRVSTIYLHQASSRPMLSILRSCFSMLFPGRGYKVNACCVSCLRMVLFSSLYVNKCLPCTEPWTNSLWTLSYQALLGENIYITMMLDYWRNW